MQRHRNRIPELLKDYKPWMKVVRKMSDDTTGQMRPEQVNK
jgi:hypothetical protein